MPTPNTLELPVINPNPKPPKRGTFGPGNPPPGKGRPPGVVNKATKDLKNGLITAATNLGRDGKGEGGLIGFLEYLGIYHTKSFCHLLSKVIPLQINAGAAVQSIGTINIVAVPADSYLSAESITKLQQPMTIENDDQPAEPIEEPADEVS